MAGGGHPERAASAGRLGERTAGAGGGGGVVEMMLLPRAVRVYVATTPCNLRRSGKESARLRPAVKV